MAKINYDLVTLPLMLSNFGTKSKCVLVRVETIHMSKFKPGTVEKNIRRTIVPPAAIEPTPLGATSVQCYDD